MPSLGAKLVSSVTFIGLATLASTMKLWLARQSQYLSSAQRVPGLDGVSDSMQLFL